MLESSRELRVGVVGIGARCYLAALADSSQVPARLVAAAELGVDRARLQAALGESEQRLERARDGEAHDVPEADEQPRERDPDRDRIYAACLVLLLAAVAAFPDLAQKLGRQVIGHPAGRFGQDLDQVIASLTGAQR